MFDASEGHLQVCAGLRSLVSVPNRSTSSGNYLGRSPPSFTHYLDVCPPWWEAKPPFWMQHRGKLLCRAPRDIRAGEDRRGIFWDNFQSSVQRPKGRCEAHPEGVRFPATNVFAPIPDREKETSRYLDQRIFLRHDMVQSFLLSAELEQMFQVPEGQ